MISPKICHCIHPFFRNYAPVSTPYSYCIGYSVIKDTVTSYFTKYTLCTDGAMSLHLLVPVGVEQGCVGCAQCAGGAWGAGALYRVYTAHCTGCADSSGGAWGANVNSWMLPIDLSAAKHC